MGKDGHVEPAAVCRAHERGTGLGAGPVSLLSLKELSQDQLWARELLLFD